MHSPRLNDNLFNFYHLIAQDIEDIINNIIYTYSPVSTKNISTNHHHVGDYIKYSILSKSSEITPLLVAFLNIEDNKPLESLEKQCVSESLIFNELITLKINSTSLFDIDYRKKLSLAKESWRDFSDLDKKLFQNEESYAKHLLIYQTDAIPNKLDSVSAPLKEYFLERQKNGKNTIQQAQETNPKTNTSDYIIKSLVKHSKISYDKINQSFMSYLEVRNNLNSYIIKEIINPIALSVNIKNESQTQDIYNYIKLKYNFSSQRYFSTVFGNMISSVDYNLNNNQIEQIEKTLYLEVLYESFKKDIKINTETYTKNIKLKDDFSKLETKNQSLYKDNLEYKYFSFFNAIKENDYKEYLPSIINSINNSFDDDGNLILKESEFHKKSNSYLDKIKDILYSTYNYIINNKTTVALGIVSLALFIRQTRMKNYYLSDTDNLNSKITTLEKELKDKVSGDKKTEKTPEVQTSSGIPAPPPMPNLTPPNKLSSEEALSREELLNKIRDGVTLRKTPEDKKKPPSNEGMFEKLKKTMKVRRESINPNKSTQSDDEDWK